MNNRTTHWTACLTGLKASLECSSFALFLQAEVSRWD
jgi:hypothetical protein